MESDFPISGRLTEEKNISVMINKLIHDKQILTSFIRSVFSGYSFYLLIWFTWPNAVFIKLGGLNAEISASF
jgi:hypothetical protein